MLITNSTIITETTNLSPYAKHYYNVFKPRYESDPELRKACVAKTLRYVEKVKDTDEYKERRREINRLCYERHKDAYRERMKLRAREKYKEKKEEKKAQMEELAKLVTVCYLDKEVQ